MLTFQQYLLDEQHTPQGIQTMLMNAAKGLHGVWWKTIKERDPEAKPGKINKVKWLKDWQCADVIVDGWSSGGERIFIELMLMPKWDDYDQYYTWVYCHDTELPKSWSKEGKGRGIYSAGMRWLADHRDEFKLNMHMGVHVSTNDEAWSRIAQKSGFTWDIHESVFYIYKRKTET